MFFFFFLRRGFEVGLVLWCYVGSLSRSFFCFLSCEFLLVGFGPNLFLFEVRLVGLELREVHQKRDRSTFLKYPTSRK